jgi:hypothetical protein
MVNLHSSFEGPANLGSFNQFSDLDARSNRGRNILYSAAPTNLSEAATSFGLVLADDSMKSEMRGTISERNREPLNTP